MVIQRQAYKIIMSKEWEERIRNSKCPVCGKHKDFWSRRKDWTCCSTNCTDEYQREVIYGWGQLREKVFMRDNYLCVKCKKKGNPNDVVGFQNNDKGLVADHIIPIALGGEQWNINNIQTLCINCDKSKTKIDHKNIGVLRKKEKLQSKGQQFLKAYQK